jgi:hypothetical protein
MERVGFVVCLDRIPCTLRSSHSEVYTCTALQSSLPERKLSQSGLESEVSGSSSTAAGAQELRLFPSGLPGMALSSGPMCRCHHEGIDGYEGNPPAARFLL